MADNDPSTTATPFDEHQLAAIVFTDVVDYSALMARDAAGTLHAVEADFRRLRKLCAHYGGTVHNTMGDGMLMCFGSATHAVVCALRVQQEFAARTKSNPAALRHRIGIHLGDIILGDEGVAGDGVNIAARILTLATPGGACMSEAVHRAVKSQVRLKVEPLGMPQLKNILEPVPVCRVNVEESRLPMRARMAMKARRSRGWAIGAVAAGLVLGAGLAWWAIERKGDKTDGPSVAGGENKGGAKSAAAPNSIAVLPFVDMSATRDQEFLGDGLTDELTTTLGRIPQLKVAARTSAFAFKGKTLSTPEIGTALRVAKLLEGTVRKGESRVRITVRLTNVEDGFQVWSETFDREPKDLVALQVEIARTIAQKLQVTLTGATRENVERLATDSAEAHALYLRGRHLLSRRGAELGEAQRLFEGAIAADEYYAAAFSGVAECHLLRALHGRVAATEAMPLARAAAERARELDPQRAEAYAALGFVRLFHDWDTRAAEEMLQRAAERDADHAGMLTWRAVARLNRGDTEGAVELVQRASALDPASPMTQAHTGWVLLLARRPAEARALLEKAVALDGSFAAGPALLSYHAEVTGDMAGAVARLEAGLKQSPGNPLLLAHLVRARAIMGDKAAARTLLGELTERGQRGYVRAYLVAVARSGFGAEENAGVLEALERAVAERDLGIATLRQSALFDGVRGQARFQQIERTVGAKLWSGRTAR